jgi:hypothetical protein
MLCGIFIDVVNFDDDAFGSRESFGKLQSDETFLLEGTKVRDEVIHIVVEPFMELEKREDLGCRGEVEGYNGPQYFERYADRLLNSPILDRVQNLAISIKYWNRIATEHANNYSDYDGPLYKKIKTSSQLKKITIVDDNYGPMRWSPLNGAELILEESKSGSFWDWARKVWVRNDRKSHWQHWGFHPNKSAILRSGQHFSL